MEEINEAIGRCKPLILKTVKKFGFLGDRYDLLETSMEIAYDAYLTYDESRGGFPNYLKNKLNFYFLDQAKKLKPKSLNDYNERGEEIIETLKDGSDLENELIKKDMVSRLMIYIEELSPVEAYVIKGKFFEGKSSKELGEELNKSPQTIYNRKLQALKKLKEKINKDDFYR